MVLWPQGHEGGASLKAKILILSIALSYPVMLLAQGMDTAKITQR